VFKKQAPAFGKPLMQEDYYRTVRAYVETLRTTTTHRQIAANLNQMGWRSPAGKPFCRATVANFIRRTSLK
jgi:flavorubredoxin